MANDIAQHIVNVMQQQQVDDLAQLKERTMRTLALRAKASVHDVDEDDEEATAVVSTEVSVVIGIHKALLSGLDQPASWVLEFNGGQLPVSAALASDFIVLASMEQLKLQMQDWLASQGYEDTAVDFEVEASIQLTLPGQHHQPWVLFRETQHFDDTCVATWAPGVGEYVRVKSSQLMDVSQHVIIPM